MTFPLREIRYAIEECQEWDFGFVPTVVDAPDHVGQITKLTDISNVLYWWVDDTDKDWAEIEVRLVFTCGWAPGFWYAAAGCDTTGWDCQSSGNQRWAPTLEGLIQFGLEQVDRERWGLT